MNKQFIISVVVLFVLSMVLGFVIHATLLADQYAALPNLYRTVEDQESQFAYMLVAHLFIAVGFTWLYRMSRQPDKSWLDQGAKFGLAIAVVSAIPIYMMYFAVQPMPQQLMFMQIAYEVPGLIVMGLAAALLNR